MQRQTLTNVQVLRFVAASGVLVKHVIDLSVPFSSQMFRVPWSGGVDLFFVISGFIMAWITRGCFGQRGAAGGFLLRRAIRIVPAYWFFTTLMVAMLLIAPQLAHHTMLTPEQVAASYGFIAWPRPSDQTMAPLLSQGWTLNYEAFFYLCFAAALCARTGLRWLVLGFVGLAMINRLIPEHLRLAIFYTDPIILEFLVGILLARLFERGVRLPLWGSLTCAGLAVAAYLLLADLPLFLANRFTTLGIPAAVLATAFILAPEPEKIGPVRRALSAGGDASYTLYLSHSFTVNAVVLACAALELPKSVGMIAAAAGAIVVAVLVYRYFERPTTTALYRIFGQRRPTEAQLVAP
jgi:peptidoglycan/LPS O-acetylase OafA/YrhL